MPTYNYIAKSFDGKKKSGQIRAKDKKDLARILKAKGFFLISAGAEAEGKSKKREKFSISFKRVSLADKMMMTGNLQVMISAGISLPKALEVLALQTKNMYFRKVLLDMKEEIIKGVALSDAIVKYPKIFSELYRSMLQTGEESGSMEETLGILFIQLERHYKLRSKIRGAMLYPAVIVVTMLLIGIVMLVKVVPQLSKTFIELGVELPPMTRFVIGLGNFFVDYWYVVILLFVALPFLFLAFIRNKQGKKYWDALLLRVPVISGLLRKINCAYTALSLSAMIKGGVPIVKSLKISSGAVNNFYFKQALQISADKVQKGQKLSVAMSDFSQFYPGVFLQMLRIGEDTGKTSGMLTKLADFFEDQVSSITQNLSSIIEPILLIIVGLVVGFFAISMIQPIYSIMQSI